MYFRDRGRRLALVFSLLVLTTGLLAWSFVPDLSHDGGWASVPARPHTPAPVGVQSDSAEDPNLEDSVARASVEAPAAFRGGALGSAQEAADLIADSSAKMDACSRSLLARCEEGATLDEMKEAAVLCKMPTQDLVERLEGELSPKSLMANSLDGTFSAQGTGSFVREAIGFYWLASKATKRIKGVNECIDRRRASNTL